MSFDISGAQQAGYSPQEISAFLAQQTPNFDYNGAKNAGYSDDEIASHLAQVNSKPSLIGATAEGAYAPVKPIVDNSLEALKGAATATGQAVSEPLNNSAVADWSQHPIMGPLDATVRTIGKAGNALSGTAGAIMSPLAGSLAASAEPLIPAEARAVKSAVQTIAPNDPRFANLNANLTPDQTHQQAMSQGADLANAVMMGKAGEQGAVNLRQQQGLPPLPKPTDPLQPLYDALSDTSPKKFLGSNSSDPQATPPPNFTPEQYQTAINQSYEQAKASRKPFYDFMNKAAQGQSIDVSSAIEPMKKVIVEIGSDPFNPARPILGRLQDFVDAYQDNPKMPLADAVEMKQDINSFFNPKKFDQGSKSPYFQVGNALDSQINKAAEANPTFGKAKALADQNHVNNVALPFTENKLLEPFWKPQDYYAQKSVENGTAGYLPDETVRRANQMLGNVKDPYQLDALTRVMPPEMASAFREALLKNKTSGGLMYRAEQLGNALGEPLSAPKHIFNALRGQPYDAATQALIDAAQKNSPSLNPDFQAQLEALKSSVPPTTPLQLTYQPTSPPPPDFIAGQSGIRAATPQEMLANELLRQQRGNMGIYPAAGIVNPENITSAQVLANLLANGK